MGYCDYTDAWVFELTRQRRRELAERRAREAEQPCVRYSVEADLPAKEIAPIPEPQPPPNWKVRLVPAKPLHRPKRFTPRFGVTVEEYDTLMRCQDGRCYICDRVFRDENWTTFDHVVPRCEGGGDGDNILLAHNPCNSMKADRLPYPCERVYLEAIKLRMNKPVKKIMEAAE